MTTVGQTRSLTAFERAVVARGSRVLLATREALPEALSVLTEATTWDMTSSLKALLPNVPSAGGTGLRRGSPPPPHESWPETVIARGLLGIESTGSVVVAERRRQDRLMIFLARRLVLLLPADAVVPAMPNAAPLLHSLLDAGQGYVTFITGPSRTSDIEQISVIGAHGPGESIVILVEGWQPTGD